MYICFIIYLLLCLNAEEGFSDSCFGVYNGIFYKFKKGDAWPSDRRCILNICKGDNQVHIERCPSVTLQEGCTLTKEDLTKQYPGCCPYPICGKSDSVRCVDTDDGTTHVPGHEWQPSSKCIHKVCLGDGTVMAFLCPQYDLPAGCTYSEINLTYSFPKCCPKLVCNNQSN